MMSLTRSKAGQGGVAALAVFCIAAVVHLAVIGVAFWREEFAPNSYDEARYVQYGEFIRAGAGMHAPGYPDNPTAYVMPLFPILIALVSPESLVAVRLVQLLLCSLTAALMFLLARRMWGAGAAWLAVFGLLTNIGWVLQPWYLLTEPLFTLFLLIAVGMFLAKPESPRWLAGVGLFLGLAWLTRGALLGVLMVLFPYLWWRVGFRKMVWVGVVMGVVIMPWVIRNYLAFDAFVPISTQSGDVLAGAYNDVTYANPWGDGWSSPHDLYREAAGEAFYDELAYNAYLTERGQEWIRENPEKVPRLWLAHFLGFVRPWFGITRNTYELTFEVLTWGISVVLLTYSAWLTLKTRQETLILLWLIILGSFLINLILLATPRYRLPYAPYFAMLGGYALHQALLRWQTWRAGKSEQARNTETNSLPA